MVDNILSDLPSPLISMLCFTSHTMLYFMQNSGGDAPLIVACGEGYADVATLLMDEGAVVNFQSKVTVI